MLQMKYYNFEITPTLEKKLMKLKKSFVLVFEIDEENTNSKVVRFLDLEHHDRVYRKR